MNSTTRRDRGILEIEALLAELRAAPDACVDDANTYLADPTRAATVADKLAVYPIAFGTLKTRSSFIATKLQIALDIYIKPKRAARGKK